MNTKNNKRRRETTDKIKKAFLNMLLETSINKISVTDICKQVGINRTTFYANYADVYDLADKIRKEIISEVDKTFSNKENHNAVTLFRLIKENRIMFNMYFKLGYDESDEGDIYDRALAEKHFDGKHLNYHIKFFKSGLNAIIKMWLTEGCRETPEEMADIIKAEYNGRSV